MALIVIPMTTSDTTIIDPMAGSALSSSRRSQFTSSP